ncbi:MAG: hypothetical protein M0Z66_04660 [Thermaerobacter sp.]|nr:hypothetical protein [Thermaerobacter sp.]
MTHHARTSLILAALLLAATAGCGVQSPHAMSGEHHGHPASTQTATPPTSTTQTLADAGVINGCDALQSIYQGFCATSPHVLVQGSDAMQVEQHVVVGQTIDVHGAVGVYTSGKPAYSDVFIKAPSGQVTLLPVDQKGGYSQEYTFSEQGAYAFGPGHWSPDTPGATFEVSYRAQPPKGSLLSQVFPLSKQSWHGLTVAAVPFGEKGSLRVRFVDAQGNPARDVTLAGTQLRTDADGFATVPYDTTPPGWPLQYVGGGLFLQTVLHVSIADGKVTGLFQQGPPGQQIPVHTLLENGVWLASAADLLQGAWLQTTHAGSVWSFTNGDETIRLDAVSGSVTVTARAGSGAVLPTVPIFVRPLTSGGQVYLTLDDLAKIVNLVAWAQPQPDGSLLLTDRVMP